jgi:hypothetical protein
MIATVGFDLTRAVADSLGGRTAVLDRLVSYLYFADVSVVEQSTWDEHGSGVSVIGTKGGGTGPAVVLATPLPSSRVLDPARAGASWPVELARFVDLMAKTWALSEIPAGAAGRPVHLVAHRPDPVGRTLRDVLDGIGPAGDVLAWGPVGPRPLEVSGSLAVLRIDASGTIAATRSPARASLTLRASSRAASSPGFAVDAFRQACRFARKPPSRAFVRPVSGTGLLPPNEVVVDLAGAASRPAAARDWTVVDPNVTRPGGVASVLCEALLDGLDRLDRDASALWERAGAEKPPVLSWPLVLDGRGPDASLVVAIALPPGVGSDGVGSMPWEASRPRAGAVTTACHVVEAGSPCDAGAPVTDAVACAPGLALPAIGRRRVMGPGPADVAADPVATARAFATAYLDEFRILLGR